MRRGEAILTSETPDVSRSFCFRLDSRPGAIPWKGGQLSEMRNYELTVIVSPEVEEEALEGAIDKVKQFVAAGGGQVTNVDIWGRRRLAYPIRKHLEGYYAVIQAQISQEALPELERNLKLSEDVIRYLLVRLDA